ncbi:hypothetical protein [Hydrogenimonas urashimensis]|uniref:hypothetical protein n=1 Tax=Hydrogenimonas urashimensis TaxID=2740515 RepID=UPI0019168259|nr:hypothetical protein [Hydrogenimonas urashimensis]
MSYRLEYAGPKPVCSGHGVVFDYAKDDRYIYLDTLIQLVEALDRRVPQEGILRFGIKKEPLDGATILEKVRKIDPGVESRMENAAEAVRNRMSVLKERTENNGLLDAAEKEAWLKNMRLMQNYVIQRGVNKAVYYLLIDRLAKELKEGSVRYIVLPMHRNFHHVAKSLGNALAKQKPPVSTYAEIFETKEGLALKFSLLP